ncbi:MAG: hypothetical protein ABR537_10275 [Gemmatimonadales bacterium]
MRVSLWVPLSILALLPVQASAQATLPDVAESAKRAVLAHDAAALVGQSSSLVLQIPGADASSPLGRAQAVELLRRYLRPAEERSLDITAIREVEAGQGFIELTRRYVVAGTTELRHETLFLGYRFVATEWRLVELRSAP